MAVSPRFSVLLPTHNRSDVLGFAIESVLVQTETDFELLIVADGCTDETSDVVSRYSDPRIRYFNLPKAPDFGYVNRNIALRESRGRLIAFIAHDDLLLPDHLKLMGDLLDSTKASWGYSRPLWVSTDGIIVPFCTNLTLDDECEDFFEKGNTIPAACVVHTRDALVKAGFWPEDIRVAADWVLWKQMIGNDRSRIAFLRQPTTLHFSADWKQSRHSKMEEVRTLLSIADHSKWWPAILKNEASKCGISEQCVVWDRIKSGKSEWVAALRVATDTVIDRLAWTAIREIIPSYEAIKMSASWRITKPLRSIARWVYSAYWLGVDFFYKSS